MAILRGVHSTRVPRVRCSSASTRFLVEEMLFLVEDLGDVRSPSRNNLSTAFPRRGMVIPGGGIRISVEENRKKAIFRRGFRERLSDGSCSVRVTQFFPREGLKHG